MYKSIFLGFNDNIRLNFIFVLNLMMPKTLFKSKNQSILGDLALYKYLMLKIDQVTLNEFNNLIENFNSKENNFNYLFSELVGIKNIIDGQYSEGKIIFESLLSDASVQMR